MNSILLRLGLPYIAVLSCTAYSMSHCEGHLLVQKDYFGEHIGFTSQSGFQKIQSGDILKINYKNGNSEQVIAHSEFPGRGKSSGQGELEYVKQQVFIPITMPDGIRVVPVDATIIDQIASVTYLGNIGEN